MTNTNNTKMVQEIKGFVMRYAFGGGWNQRSKAEFADEANTIIDLVLDGKFGLPSDIAETCKKYKRVSEKQAWHIANCAVSNNLHSRIEYLYA